MLEPLHIVILAAGKGTRMRSQLPKVMHPLANQPLIAHVRRTAEALNPASLITVAAEDAPNVVAAMAPYPCVIQRERLGTGHALQTALQQHAFASGWVVVVYGDTPLLQAGTIRRMCATFTEHPNTGVVALGFHTDNPHGYGRLLVQGGMLQAIVEEKEATPLQRAITLCNAGIMAFRTDLLPALLARLDNNNSKQEYYLTDTVAHARHLGVDARMVEVDAGQVLGINTRAELATVEALLQQRLRQTHLEAGVTLVAPETVFFSADTVIEADVVVEPFVVIGTGVRIASGSHIKAYSHLEGCSIGSNCVVGPYARLRPDTVLADDVRIGNFVELKKTTMGQGSKANHVSYMGDSRVGQDCNNGAGTIN